MAVQRGRRRAVSSYSAGGFSDEQDLYLSALRPGSRRDRLRDLNRAGYAGGGDSPDPFFEGETWGEESQESRGKQTGNFLAAIREEVARDRAGAALCAFLLAAVLALGGFWCSRMAVSARNRRDIESYRQRTEAILAANATLRAELARVQDGERIRNLAMNEHGMRRRERAETMEIYVQVPEMGNPVSARPAEETKFEMLDFLLGLLDRLNIGG